MFAKRICIFVLLLAALCCRDSAHAQSAKYAGAFLEIPVGAKALAMGGAYTALADDESSFHWNPAGVALVHHQLVGFMYSSEFGTPGSSLADFWHGGFTLPLASVTLAANWERLSIGDLVATPDLTNVSVTNERQQLVRQYFGATPNYFSDHEDAFVISIARYNKFILDWGWLYYKQEIEVPIGINFKLIRQSIGSYGVGQGIGVDAGAMLRFSLGKFLLVPALGKISLAASVSDLAGTRLNWNTQQQQIVPMHINGGLAYEQQIPIISTVATISSDFMVVEHEKPRFGLDITYKDNLSLRFGMNRGLFATGAGFNWDKKVTLNYSLGINPDLGPEHRLSFAVDLDNIFRPDSL